LHVIVEQLLSNIEMTFQDNGVGVFKQLVLAHPEMTSANQLLNAQMKAYPNRSITVLAPQFDYFQIEANGLHFPEELAPEPSADNAEELFEQGTTVIMGLTLN
jgi:enoyl reductase-like protein